MFVYMYMYQDPVDVMHKNMMLGRKKVCEFLGRTEAHQHGGQRALQAFWHVGGHRHVMGPGQTATYRAYGE